MENLESLQPTQDERVMAALSHVSALIPFMGALAPIIIWATQKEKSKYIAFQSLQALAYQLTNVAVVILGYACYFVGLFASVIIMTAVGASGRADADFLPVLVMIIPMGVFLLIGLFELFFILYGIVAAVLSLQGKPFKYMLIGSRVQRYMEKKDEENVSAGA